MKLILIPLSAGSLGKNTGTELAPQLLAKNIKAKKNIVKIIESDLEETHKQILEATLKTLKQKTKTIIIGGDHSLTYSTFRAFAKTFEKSFIKTLTQKTFCGKNIGLIVFDAHLDLMHYSSLPSHEDWLRKLIEEKKILPKNVLLIGIRRVWKQETEFSLQKKLKIIKASEVKKNLKKTKRIIEVFLKKIDYCYLSVDIDSFDPGIAPATGYLEKNGLKEKEFFELLETIMNSKKTFVFDLVEVNPKKDSGKKTIKLGRKVLTTFAEP